MDAQRVDVVVIGGGVIGVAVAYYAARRGAAVLVVEKGSIGSGSSYGNAGLLAPSHCQPLASPGVITKGLRYLLEPESPLYIRLRPDYGLAKWLWKFCRYCSERHLYHSVGVLRKLGMESIDLHEELAQTADSAYEYRRNGLLTVYAEEQSFAEGQDFAGYMRTFGIESNILRGDEVRDVEPEISPQVVGALYHTVEGMLDPAAFVAWLRKEAESRGVRFLSDTTVFAFDASHRRVSTIVTTRGNFEADQVVLASGAWTTGLARLLGIRIPIRAAKGYSLTYERPERAPKIPLILDEVRVAVTPFAESIRLAGTLAFTGLDLKIDRHRLENIRTQTSQYLPGLGSMNIKEVWPGLRPCTPDGLPILGRLRPYSNVLIAGGHGTKGMLLAPVTGRIISQMLSGERIGMMERNLRPDRF